MERTPVLALVGTGLEALDLGTGARPARGTTDPAAEPAGYLVAMDGGVRIHFLDWGGPALRDRTSPAAVAPGDLPGPHGSDRQDSLDRPDAPGILLIHGLARTAWSWAPVARLLRADARVAAMDLRGHGLSDAPTEGYDPDHLAEDAIAVAEGTALLAGGDAPRPAGSGGGRRFVVAGHGYGAIVAAWAANALGDACSGLVLVDGGWTDLAAETEMTPDEWLSAIAEPPEVLTSMAAWLADREAFEFGHVGRRRGAIRACRGRRDGGGPRQARDPRPCARRLGRRHVDV